MLTARRNAISMFIIDKKISVIRVLPAKLSKEEFLLWYNQYYQNPNGQEEQSPAVKASLDLSNDSFKYSLKFNVSRDILSTK